MKILKEKFAPNKGWIDIETDNNSYIIGRNGTFKIYSVRVSVTEKYTFIDGIGKHGNIIRGGIVISKECMEAISKEFLRDCKRDK